MGASSAGLPCLDRWGASGDSDGSEGQNHNLSSFNKTIINRILMHVSGCFFCQEYQ